MNWNERTFDWRKMDDIINEVLMELGIMKESQVTKVDPKMLVAYRGQLHLGRGEDPAYYDGWNLNNVIVGVQYISKMYEEGILRIADSEYMEDAYKEIKKLAEPHLRELYSQIKPGDVDVLVEDVMVKLYEDAREYIDEISDDYFLDEI